MKAATGHAEALSESPEIEAEDADPSESLSEWILVPAEEPVARENARATLPDAEPTRANERLVFSAEKEIVFRCGKASLTLTRAGKILLRGEYLLTEATGVNRIRGGTVEIN